MGGAALHFGNIAEMRTGEGKTLTARAPRLPQRADRQGRARRHGQRLPGQARRRVDGPDPPVPRPRGRRDPGRDGRPRSAASSTPPTSPTARTTSSASTTCATTWPGRLEECVQRGHHFAIVDEVDSILIDEARTPLIISGPAEQNAAGTPSSPRSSPRLRRGRGRRGRLRGRREEAHRRHPRVRRGEGRGLARHRQPLRLGRTRRWSASSTTRIKAKELYKKDKDYVVIERRGPDRRRVHRPHPARPPLQRGHAPGHRGQGRRQDQGREPDSRHDHAAELLPALRASSPA